MNIGIAITYFPGVESLCQDGAPRDSTSWDQFLRLYSFGNGGSNDKSQYKLTCFMDVTSLLMAVTASKNFRATFFRVLLINTTPPTIVS
jgi:hypothetical protein